MRKFIIVPALLAFALLSLTSCEKENQLVLEQTFDKTLKANESATFILPATTSENKFQITTAASHAYVSKISEDIAGNSIYCYTPEKDYVGTDLIIVSSIEEEDQMQSNSHHSNGNNKNKGSHCSKGDKSNEKVIVTINLTIVKENTTTITSTKEISATN